jgi:hypothetical protein
MESRVKRYSQSIPEMHPEVTLVVMAWSASQLGKLSRQCHNHEGIKIAAFMIFATGTQQEC